MNRIADRITEARAALTKARRDAAAVWEMYAKEETQRTPGVHPSAARAQAATRLPEDLRALLGIDRYGARS